MIERSEKSVQAAWRFFAGVGRKANAMQPRDIETIPLFPLPLILEAEGLLASDVKLGPKQ